MKGVKAGVARCTVGLAIATSLTLSGCGGSVTGDSGSGSSTNADGKTETLLWHAYSEASAAAATTLIDKFNESSTTCLINAEYAASSEQFSAKLINAITNEQSPAIVLGDSRPQSLAQIVETGAVLSMEDFLNDSSTSVSMDDFTEGLLSTGMVDGTLYSIPTDAGDYAIVYNKQMFADAGITETPTTWAELVEAAKKLTKGTTQYGIYLPISEGEWPVFTWQSMLWSAGGEFLNADNTKVEFNSDAGVEALTAWVDLVKDGYAYPQSLWAEGNNGGTAALTAKQAAMAYDGAYNLGVLDEALGEENVGVFAVPGLTTQGMNLGTDNSYLLKSTPEQESCAKEFLAYWLSPDVQAEWCIETGYFPTNSDTAEVASWKAYLDENPRRAVFVSELEYAKARPSILEYAEVSSALSEAITKAMTQKASPKEALDEAATKAQSILDGA